jgi:two-component system chemotaxis response regulator CheY
MAGREELMLERLEAMGLEVEDSPSGPVALLPVGEAPFPGLRQPTAVKQVRFAAVGAGSVKCLEPQFLFYLPLVAVSDCTEAEDLEARIRIAWQAHLAGVRRGREELERLGIEFELEAGDAVLCFDLGTDDPRARGRTADLRQVVLPTAGPLAGRALAAPEERLFAPEPHADSGLDVQIAITTRLESLARTADERDAERRAEAARNQGRPGRTVRQRNHRVLLVGPYLASNIGLAESLRMRGYEVVAAPTDGEAMDAFCSRSFELMLVDSHLGRADGLELVPLIQTLAGVERLPVVIVDEHPRLAVRDRARQIGAVGYLTRPVDAARIAPGLARLLQAPRYRRYSRYPKRLAVRCGSLRTPGFTTAIGRLGMFVCTSRESPVHALEDYEISLDGLGETLRVEAETIFARTASADVGAGLGLRFHDFPDDGSETRLIAYLKTLEPEG